MSAPTAEASSIVPRLADRRSDLRSAAAIAVHTAVVFAPVYLAAHAYESPEGWQLAGAIPVALEAGKGIEVTGEMTVQNLASELATRAAQKLNRIGLAKK